MKIKLKNSSANFIFKTFFERKEFKVLEDYEDMFRILTPCGKTWISKNDCIMDESDVFSLEVEDISIKGEPVSAKSYVPLDVGDLVACKMEDYDTYIIGRVTRATKRGLYDVPFTMFTVLGKIDNFDYEVKTKNIFCL